MSILQTRRDFVASASGVGAASLLAGTTALADEGPPETTTIRMASDPGICFAPAYIADDLLRAEGFTDIRLLPFSGGSPVASGEIDFDFASGPWLASHLGTGEPLTVLAGVHSGCYELFAHEPVGTISDLKGRKVGVEGLGSGRHLWLRIIAAYIGLDPERDIDWVVSPKTKPMALFEVGEIDAFLGFPPEPQELHARKIGQVILNTTTDKPWSQYFCCMAYGNRAFVREHPIATKRYLRAVLRAADICAAAPETAARRMVDGGFTPRYDYAFQTLRDLPYASWREFDPEDTLRFYALRLQDVGLIKSSPQKIIAEGTDWRFLNEIKRELKV